MRLSSNQIVESNGTLFDVFVNNYIFGTVSLLSFIYLFNLIVLFVCLQELRRDFQEEDVHSVDMKYLILIYLTYFSIVHPYR